ncbi:MAG: glycosyltransferase family 2 protein [Lactobacillaceae bacterium]|jgi:GT2 family glycosyltransferase|nr:glycosyltransferase family 2 protein [Lactobacillaceae bacterium]
MNEHKVAAAIVTYNRLELLKESLTAVLNQSDYLSHVIVVNNQSTDGTGDYLASLKDPRVVVYNAPENLGGAGGFNQAVRLFMEETADDYVWLMDDDTIAQPDALKYLIEFLQTNPKVGFVNSQVRWGSVQGNSSWMNVPAPRAFTWQNKMISNNPGIEVVNSTFVSVLFARSTVAMVGLPQKEYFIWGDDMEYTNRIARINPGYTVLNSIVVHKSKENSIPGDIVSERDAKRLWRYDYEYRNRVLTARRVCKKELVRILVKAVLVDLRKVILGHDIKFRGKKIKMILGGLMRGIQFKPVIEYPNTPRNYDVRSIQRIAAAGYLAFPDLTHSIDQDLEFIERYELDDLKGNTAAADQFIADYDASVVQAEANN